MPKIFNAAADQISKNLNETKPLPSYNQNHEKLDVNFDLLNFNTTIEDSQEPDLSLLKIEMDSGKATWLFAIDLLLKHTKKILHEHQWTIYKMTDGIELPLTDDPVICLNYYSDYNYDFGGGWGFEGGEIMMPISPNYMLYTQIGKEVISNTTANLRMSQLFQQLSIEHAHRFVYARQRIPFIRMIKKRIVDEQLYKNEQELWHSFSKLDSN